MTGVGGFLAAVIFLRFIEPDAKTTRCWYNTSACCATPVRKIKRAHPFYVDAIVVLPEHLHCVLASEGDADYSNRWRQIKSAFSEKIPHGEYRTDSRHRKNGRGIWQRRFWEHVIRNEEAYAALVYSL